MQYPCFCCGFLTLTEEPPGTFNICPVCRWEDDNVQARDPDYAGGANKLSLRQARESFRRSGVSDPAHAKHARPPQEHEIPKPTDS